MIDNEDVLDLILASFFLRRGGYSLHRLSYCLIVLAAAGKRMQGCNALGFLSAMISVLGLCCVEREIRRNAWSIDMR